MASSCSDGPAYSSQLIAQDACLAGTSAAKIMKPGCRISYHATPTPVSTSYLVHGAGRAKRVRHRHIGAAAGLFQMNHDAISHARVMDMESTLLWCIPAGEMAADPLLGLVRLIGVAGLVSIGATVMD